MTTSFPLSEREKLIDGELVELRDVIAELMIGIGKIERGLSLKINKLDDSNNKLHELTTCLVLKIQRLEAHTACDKYVPGLDDPAEGEK